MRHKNLGDVQNKRKRIVHTLLSHSVIYKQRPIEFSGRQGEHQFYQAYPARKNASTNPGSLNSKSHARSCIGNMEIEADALW